MDIHITNWKGQSNQAYPNYPGVRGHNDGPPYPHRRRNWIPSKMNEFPFNGSGPQGFAHGGRFKRQMHYRFENLVCRRCRQHGHRASNCYTRAPRQPYGTPLSYQPQHCGNSPKQLNEFCQPSYQQEN